MKQFERFGVDLLQDEYIQTSIYGVASVYSLIDRELENYFKGFKLSASKFNILMIIKHQGKDEGISQVEIGKRLVVTASNMTKQIDKLIAEELVERTAQKGDRRVNLIKITKKGSDLLDKVWPGYYDKAVNMANMIEKDERETLVKILAKWFEKLESQNK
jgi:MarR family 2-MHQ and catechol resistance regulon transcriptional repressor